MRRLMLFVLGVLLAVPSLASAWTITAKIGTASGSISGGSPTRTTVSTGTGYLTVPAGDATVTISPAPGYAVSSVTVDGVSLATPATGGNVVVAQAGKTSRTLIANFTVVKSSMTINQAPNGNIMMRQISPTTGNYTQTVLSSLTYGRMIAITATPYTGYQLTSINVGGTAVWTGTTQGAQTYNYTVGTSDVTVTASYSLVPTAHAALVVQSTTGVINSPLTLSASSSTTNDPALTYRFSLVSGDAGKVTINQSPTSPTATFQASAAGSYTVNVTVTSAHGASDATAGTSIALATVGDWESGVCASCHTNRDSLISSQYKQSVHSLTGGIGCPSCHNPGGSTPHPHIVSPVGSCQPCHSSATANVVNDFVAGPHNGNIVCTSCHSDHSEKADITICQNCHNVAFSTNGNHAMFVGQPDICVKCHNMHNPHSGASAYHFNGYTSYANPGYHAAYVTPRTACSNCHLTTTLDGATFTTGDGAMKDIRLQWADSGHGDATSRAFKSLPAYDWKTLGSTGVKLSNSSSAVDCVRCHTAKGFLKFAVYSGTFPPVGMASDKSSEPLACNACHTPGFVQKQLRTRRTHVIQIPAVTSYYNYSTAGFKVADYYVYNNLGDSNLCISCHSGKMTGFSVYLADGALDFSNAAFFDVHSMPAAPVLFRIAGYIYFPENVVTHLYPAYRETANHMLDGSDEGACVMCHMDSGTYSAQYDNNHSFKPLTRDATGAVVAIANPGCAPCHSGMSAGTLNDLSSGFQAALKALAAQFAAKGMHYNPDVAPYFFKSAADTSPSNAVRNWGSAHTMGAAYNLNMLTKEKGAYAHSPNLTKEELYDSIDFMDDGLINDSVAATLQSLSADPQYTPAISYLLLNGKRR